MYLFPLLTNHQRLFTEQYRGISILGIDIQGDDHMFTVQQTHFLPHLQKRLHLLHARIENIHWNGNVVILTKFSSLVSQGSFGITPSGIARFKSDPLAAFTFYSSPALGTEKQQEGQIWIGLLRTQPAKLKCSVDEIFVTDSCWLRKLSKSPESATTAHVPLQWRHNERDGVSNHSAVYFDADQGKYSSSASLAFVMGLHRWPVNSPHKGPVTRKCFDLMTSSWKSPDGASTAHVLQTYLRPAGLLSRACPFPSFRWNHDRSPAWTFQGQLSAWCSERFNIDHIEAETKRCHLKCITLHSTKFIWKCRLWNGGHFVQGEMS